MPNLFRTLDGQIRKPSQAISFELADGSVLEGVWAGSAQEEKLNWWLRNPGSDLAQSEPVAEIATKADDDDELQWGDAPTGARLFFVLQAPEPGKSYRKALMVTTAATPAQTVYFRHDRFSLFGHLKPDGSIVKIPPLDAPRPRPKAQGELF